MFEVAVADTRPCVFNVFRDDCSPDLWTQVLAAPVKTALGLFQEGTAFLCGKPWKRRWVCQANECEPTRAELFAFTGFLRTQSIENDAILPLAEARASALLLIEHKGLTRSRKGYGARLSEADYPAVWTRLHPNETQPELKLGRLLYRLQPAPRGIDASDLRRWLQDIRWRNTTVVRSVASDVWLVAALTEPPAEFVQMNHHTVLAKPAT